MDVLTIGLIAAATWIVLLGAVLALCRAAAQSDAASERHFLRSRRSANVTYLPTVETPPEQVVRRA